MLRGVSSQRAICYRCFKPEITCICAQLPCVDNKIEVVVLQHPRERMHPIGTARFARLGLRNASVHVAWNAAHVEGEDAAPAWIGPHAGLLYPTAQALDLAALPCDQHPRQLVVLDGTWHTAKTLYRQKRWLHQLPHYRLAPTEPGRYRIRREPQLDYVSTIEAIVAALRILDPDAQGLGELLQAFDAMIDAQLALEHEHRERFGNQARTHQRGRAKHQRCVPHALVEGYPQLVVVYGEAARGGTEVTTEFAYFVAQQVASGARFACVVRPRTGLPSDLMLQYMGLPREVFANGVTTPEFCERWATFLTGVQAPILAAWNQSTLELLARVTGQSMPQISLKSAYRALHGTRPFSLDEVVAQPGLILPEPNFEGRAGIRLAGALAVAEFLHARSA